MTVTVQVRLRSEPKFELLSLMTEAAAAQYVDLMTEKVRSGCLWVHNCTQVVIASRDT